MAKRKYLGAKEIMRRIPHRYPFLMIDRIVDAGPDTACALKNVTIDEPFFAGHFAAEPILPGVLLGEAMAQTAAFIGASINGEPSDGIGSKAFLTSINLKIQHSVVPGDQLLLKAKLVKRLGQLTRISAQASVDGAIVATADLTVAMVDGGVP